MSKICCMYNIVLNMDEDDFYDRVMAVIIKLTSKSMPKEKLQI